MRGGVLAFLLLCTWVVTVYHLSTAPDLKLPLKYSLENKKFIPKQVHGIHQLILSGSPVERGLFAGERTKDLLFIEEMSLQKELKKIIPNAFLQRVFFFGLMRWFWGVEKYFESSMLEEMWGVSKATTDGLNFLADPYTRQIAYHGLHEIGQSMVDANPQSFGCTVIALPYNSGWILGRNFDFEGGRIFDEEKIMKWTYPEKGYAFLSVIWAGMVGAVTGVNEKGVYISLNAAGTSDFKRMGTPSTLVLAKALQFAANKEEARKIIEESEMFITDIFVVADNRSASFLRIEKSPKRVAVLEHHSATAVANHLVDPIWANDKINRIRREEMTSQSRQERGEYLLKKLPRLNESESVRAVLAILRDKSNVKEKKLHLGNRGAIDGLIATHSVIWNSKRNILYVSQGPSLSGPFLGVDLQASFQKKEIVKVKSLPADPEVSPEIYAKVFLLNEKISKIKMLFEKEKIDSLKSELNEAHALGIENWNLSALQGDYALLQKNLKLAKTYWLKAQDLEPPYLADRVELKRKLKR